MKAQIDANGKPYNSKVYDFIDKDLGKAIPYGVYDIANNEGWVSVGISHDTASFAVSTIWWHEMGKKNLKKKSNRIFITAAMAEGAIKDLEMEN